MVQAKALISVFIMLNIKRSTLFHLIQKFNRDQSKFHFDFANDNNYYLQM